MIAHLMVLVSTILLLVLWPQCSLAEDSHDKQIDTSIDMELPSALADDDSFNELPFEQLRQALREEVERDPQRSIPHTSSKKYNWLIR